MKKITLTILCAALFCLSLQAPQARAENPRGFTSPVKPDLTIVKVACCYPDRVTFTILSSGASVPAGTITVQVFIREKNSTAMVYDYLHEAVIQQDIPADTPTEITIILPADKLVLDRVFNLYIDSSNKVDESDETNNVSQNQNVTPSFPDLPPIDLQFMQWAFVDETTVSLKVISRKKPSPAGSFEVWVATTNKDGTPAWEEQATFPVDIPADKLATMDFKAPEGKDFMGKKFRVVVDYGGKVPEHNEDNNYSGPYSTANLDQFTKADVSFKEAIYYKLGQPDSQAGTPTAPLKVKKSEAQPCGGLNCVYITVRLLKSPADIGAKPGLKVTNLTTGKIDNYPTSVTIKPGETSADSLLVVALKDGLNQLKFEVYSSGSFTDTDATNNALEVAVNLMADK